MEPVSVPRERGTLEDPEILKNVPGHVIPILEREFDDFKTEATKFLAGEIGPAIHRLLPGESGQGHLRLVRHRHHAASER